jgi:hypothetical protein
VSTQPAAPDLAALYPVTRERVTGLVTGLGAAEFARPVPACAAWTVRDVGQDGPVSGR